MVSTRLTYTVDKNSNPIVQFERDQMGEAIEQVAHLGRCSTAQAKAVSAKAMHCLKTAYADKNIPEQPILWKAFLNFAAQEMQSIQKNLDQNFGLTEAEFETMTATLRAGDKSMFEHVFLAHFAACRNFVCRTYKASMEDAYDATMETLMEFHHKLAAGKIQYGNLRYLFTKMAGQCYLKNQRQQEAVQNIPTEVFLSNAADQDHDADRLLDKAWEKLCEECRHVLKSFYYEGKNLQILSVEMGKDHTAMRKQKQRCVDRLRIHFMRFL